MFGETFMKPAIAQSTKIKQNQNVISVLTVRTQLGQILKRASEKDERFVVDRPGKPSVMIMSVRDYIRNIAPPHPAFVAIREEAKKNGTSELSMREIDREIAAHRRQAKKKRSQPTA
jgi:hypothetical protein